MKKRRIGDSTQSGIAEDYSGSDDNAYVDSGAQECMLPDFSAKHIRFDFSAGETRLAHRLFEAAHLWALTGI